MKVNFKKFGMMSLLVVMFFAIIGNAIMLLGIFHDENNKEREYQIIDVCKVMSEYDDLIEERERQKNERYIIDTIVSISGNKIDFEYAEEIYNEVIIVSEKYKFEPSLVLGMIAQESRFNINAKSNKNALGLMQITSIALNDYNRINKTNYSMKDMYDISINVDVGCWTLNRQKQYLQTESIKECIIAYNSGVGNFKKHKNEYLIKYSYEEKVREFKSKFEGKTILI